MYNLTFLDNVTNPLELYTGLNQITGGLLSILIIFFIFLILNAVFQNNTPLDNILISSFIISILAGLFWFIGLVGASVALFPLGALIITLLIKFVWVRE